MNKRLHIIFFLIVVLGSCSSDSFKSEEQKKADRDSFSMKKYGKSAEEHIADIRDSLTNKVTDEVYGDTAGLWKAPVKIIKASFFRKEYSSYRDIRLTYKNISSKKIEGIKFQWKGVDAFGEKADMGGSTPGYGGGFTDDPLKPGRFETGEWSISSRDGKKLIMAWPIEVAFSDGTKWAISK